MISFVGGSTRLGVNFTCVGGRVCVILRSLEGLDFGAFPCLILFCLPNKVDAF